MQKTESWRKVAWLSSGSDSADTSFGEELLQEIDKNGDGSIDFEEFMDMMERPVCKLIEGQDVNLWGTIAAFV